MHELAALVPAASNAAHYARIVHEMATLRGLIRAGNDIARLGFDRPGETIELVDRAEQIVFDLSQQRVSSEFAHIDELLKDSFETITTLYEAGSDITGHAVRASATSTASRPASSPGNLIIVAARPSMGKSALALGMAANVAVRDDTAGRAVHARDVEVRGDAAPDVRRGQGRVAAPAHRQARRRRLAAPDGRVRQAREGADLRRRHRLDHDDGDPVEAAAPEDRSEPNLGLVIVDYLQLMTSGTNVENRVQEVSQISRSLKVLARDLEVPIVALSQLSRAVEQRHDKRPILSDLRESGSIEQDADLVMFVYRDEYYNPEDTESAGIAELILAKHRNGAPASRSSRSRSGTRSSPTWRPPRDGAATTVWLCAVGDVASRASARRASSRRGRRGRSLSDALHDASVRGSIRGRRRRVRALPRRARDRDPARVERPPGLATPRRQAAAARA